MTERTADPRGTDGTREPLTAGTGLEGGRFFAALAGIAAVSVVLRIPFFQVPMINDEGGYAYVAHFWSSDYQLYRDIPFYRPQAIFHLYQAIFWTLGEDVAAIRLFAALYNAVTVVVIGLLGRSLYAAGAGLGAAAIFALFSAGPSMEGFTANAEIFAQLPIAVSALLAWRRQWAWAGFMAACAVLLKPSGLSVLLLAVAWSFVAGGSVRAAFRVAFAFGLGLLPSVLHGAWVGWEYYWESMVTHRAKFADEQSRSVLTQWARFTGGVAATVPSWGVPAALGLAGLARPLGRPERFALLWLGTSILGMAMGGFWFEHYFIQLLPPLAILAGAGLVSWPRGRTGVLLAIPVVLAIVGFRVDAGLWTSSPQETSWSLYAKPGYTMQSEIAEYVRAETRPGDPIFVAFSQAEIYYLARRKAAWPHMYLADFEYSQELFDGAVRSIRNREPAMVVVAQAPPPNRMSMNEFLALLSEGYERVHVVRSERSNSAAAQLFRRK